LLANIKKGSFNLVFIGGLGIHYLTRSPLFHPDGNRLSQHSPMVADFKDDPVELHRFLIRDHLHAWAQLGSELGVPLIFVGSMPVQATSIFLSPPKKDWPLFYDFSLAEIWVSVEAQEYKCLVTSWPPEVQRCPPLRYFDLSELTGTCGAIRCDGMHFGSFAAPNEGYECKSSAHLWDPVVTNFILRSFPTTNMSSLESCRKK
jgi:hypothetical protein